MNEATRRKPAHVRRAELLDVAVSSYLELGLGRAGHGDIARRAGVSTGTVFNYFPTRELLTKAVLDHVASVIVRIFDNIGPPAPSIRENITMIQNGLDRGCELYPDLIKLFLSWAHSFSPELRGSYLEFHDELARLATPYLATDTDRSNAFAELDARIMLGAGTIYMQMFYDGTPSEARNAFAQRFATLVTSAQG